MPQTTITVTPTITETPSIFWGFEAGDYLGQRECEVRIYEGGAVATAGRKYLSIENKVDQVEFEILERGGCGKGSLSILATWDELQFAGNERADIYLFGRPIYRGWVRVSENNLAAEERVSPQLYGLMEQFDHWIVRRPFAYGTGGAAVDMSVVFSALVNHAAIRTGRVPSATLDVETTGVLLTEFDARGTSLASALNRLLDIATDVAIWGCDFDTTPDWRGIRQDRIYLRRRDTTCRTVYALGKNVTGYTYPRDASRVVNKLILTGGSAAQPNIMTNGGFENCVRASEDAGNYLLNHSFETGGSNSAPDDWTSYGGTPAGKWPGEGGAFGSARSETHWLELDQGGEAVYQDVYPVLGLSYVASVWARLEDPDQTNAFTIWLIGYDVASAAVVQAYSSFDSGTDPPLDGIYRKFTTAAIDLADYPTVVRIRILLSANGGTENNDGVIFDDAGIYEYGGEAQEFWHVTPTGNARIQELDWAYTGAVTPHSGGLCIKMTCSDIATSADTGELYTFGSKSPSVNPNERYTLLMFWHVDGDGTSLDEALSIGVVNIKSDNTQGTLVDSRDEVGVTYGNPSTWTRISLPIITEADTVRLQVFIRVRTNRTIYLDDMMLVQGEVPPDVLQYGDFWSGDQYEAEIACTDTGLSVSGDALASITNYGQREATETVEDVIDHASLLTFAGPYFNAHAVPEIMGGMTVEGPEAAIPQTGTVRLVNLPNGPDELFPSRIRYTIGESIRADADLGRSSQDMMDLLNMTAARAGR